MPSWLKVVLIVLLLLVLFLAAIAFFGYRWAKSHAGELRADAEKIKTEATSFARGKDPAACVDETFARMSRCDGIMCDVRAKLFLQNCVAASNIPPGFCTSIPKPSEILATAQWSLAECGRRGKPNDQRCTRVITALQDVCSGPHH